MTWVWAALAAWLVASIVAAPVVGRLLRRSAERSTHNLDQRIDLRTTVPSLAAHEREHETLEALWVRAVDARDHRDVATAVCDALIAHGARGVALATFTEDAAIVLGTAGAPPWDAVPGRAGRAVATALRRAAEFGPRIDHDDPMVGPGSSGCATVTAPLGSRERPAGLLALRIAGRDVSEAATLALVIHVAAVAAGVFVGDDDVVIDLVDRAHA